MVIGKITKGPGFRVDITAPDPPTPTWGSRKRRKRAEARQRALNRKNDLWSKFAQRIHKLNYPALAIEHVAPCPAVCPVGMAVIYALVDPRDGTVRYLGRSVVPGDRMDRHLEHPHSKRLGVWFKALRKRGLKPDMHGVDLVAIADWPRAETEAIAFYRARGALLNIEPGGVSKKTNGPLLRR